MTDHHNEHEFCRHDRLDKRGWAEIDPDRNGYLLEYHLNRRRAHIQAGEDIDKAKIYIDDLCKTLRFSGGRIESFRKLLDYTNHIVSISWTESEWRPYELQCRVVSEYAVNALESLKIS